MNKRAERSVHGAENGSMFGGGLEGERSVIASESAGHFGPKGDVAVTIAELHSVVSCGEDVDRARAVGGAHGIKEEN